MLNAPGISILDKLVEIDDAIDDNADIADAILTLALETFDLPEKPDKESSMNWHDKARTLDLSKAHSTIKQFWRDWSWEGFSAEVKPVLDIVLGDLASYTASPPANTRVLLPGAGLGRLLYELCMAGYIVEGNEISYHQLLASNFILNTTSYANQYKLYPFVNGFNNHTSRRSQLHYVTIPDVHPGTTMGERMTAGLAIGEMNMTAGDFITSYSSSESSASFNAVVTVYFIDTAPNVIRYVETIYNCLEMGGIWINIGPLLWHFEDRNQDNHEMNQDDDDDANKEEGKDISKEAMGIAEPGSFELTNEEVLDLVQRMGFELVIDSLMPSMDGGYIQDPASMLQHVYKCSHWIVRKVGP